MAKFDSKTIAFGRVEYTNCTVHVYRSIHDRIALLLPCGTVLDARWVGSTVQVQMSNGWTYVFEGTGSYTNAWKR
jgi:hypothetical protein